jgi:hypothetical protein
MQRWNPPTTAIIEDMTVRNLSPATRRCSVHAVAKFSQYDDIWLCHIGSALCCPRAASGQALAPPSSVINLRRFI